MLRWFFVLTSTDSESLFNTLIEFWMKFLRIIFMNTRTSETLPDFFSELFPQMRRLLIFKMPSPIIERSIIDQDGREHVIQTNNSAYDYRVVMRKDNAELDMSGRCSAGQKMLASIIIRLALAETFSVNCGVIALDEPTTNLDSQNMTNLANQLACLVESRQSSNGRPFQLIVITHNTEFARLLYQNGSFAHFYQITRASDGTHHYSQIKKRTDFGSY